MAGIISNSQNWTGVTKNINNAVEKFNSRGTDYNPLPIELRSRLGHLKLTTQLKDRSELLIIKKGGDYKMTDGSWPRHDNGPGKFKLDTGEIQTGWGEN